MTTATPTRIEKPAVKPTITADPARLFYFGAAIILLALALWGFEQFYFHGKAYPDRPLTPPIRTLLIQHGIVMAAWLLLFLVQPLLIVMRKHRAHMMLGKFGAALAAIIVYLGMRVGIESARVNPPDLLLWNLPPKQFMAVPLVSIAIFALFIAIAIWKRRRPAIHRAMMLLAGLSVMAAALDRIAPIRNLYADTIFGTLFGPFGSSLAIGALFVLINWALTRHIDRYLAAGVAAMTVASAMIMQLATTQRWDTFAGWALG